MTTLQVIAIVIVAGCLTYFLYDVIRHAKARGGSPKNIIVRIIFWLLVFGAFVVINVLINANWIPGKWMLRIRF